MNLRAKTIRLAACLSLLFAGQSFAAKLPEFPKPSPAQAFAEFKIFGTNGSPVRTPLEDWSRARQRVANDPEWRDWIAQNRRSLEDWIAKRSDKVGWIAGWHHDFVSPKDGSFLTFTADEPGEETLSSPSDRQVKLTPKLHAAWVYEFRMRNAGMMIEAARLFRLTGDVKYAHWAAGQLDFYADNYNQWPTRNGTHFMYQSLDEAVILTRWITTARMLGDLVPARQKELWSGNLFKPQAKLLNTTLQTVHNIACWQRSAVGQVALYCQDDALWQIAVEGPFGIRNQVRRGVTSDYIWFEQSLGYNGYVVKALAPFFEYALMEGRGAGLETEMATVENLLLSPLVMRFPNGQLPNPADAGKPQRLSMVSMNAPESGEADYSSETLANFWSLYPTKPGLALLQNTRPKSWELLLDPPPATPVAETLSPVTSHNLESSRMAIIRSGPWQVYFHYGQITSTHSQAEALNYEVFYRDIDVSHDPGTTGYGSKFTTEFFRSGPCHNVPLVDGLGEDSWHLGRLENFSRTNVAASQREYRPDASARRSLTIVGDKLLDQVSIATTDGTNHLLGFVLNLQGRVKLSDDFKSAPGFSRTHPNVAFNYWQEVQSANAEDRAVLEVEFKGATIEVQFQLPGKFTIFHAQAPDYPPARREVLFVETQGKEATLRTIFSSPKNSGHVSKPVQDDLGEFQVDP